MAEGRRIYYDNEDNDIYNKLKTTKIFKKADNLDIFSISLILGWNSARRTSLGKGSKGRIRESTVNSSKVIRYLMMAIAVEEEGINVLSDDEDENGKIIKTAEDKYFLISEEYAKTGLKILDNRIKTDDDILTSMETELIEFYADNIHPQEE
ncbi:MAG: hypothetical protein LBM96_09430 [Methanobrevibacter sp.]|jgi:hypothetical protein|nr:hypothetical protein [Candidatus Methanoflexus mossambicus]